MHESSQTWIPAPALRRTSSWSAIRRTWRISARPPEFDLKFSRVVNEHMIGQMVHREFAAIYLSMVGVAFLTVCVAWEVGLAVVLPVVALRLASLVNNHRLSHKILEAISRQEDYSADLRFLTIGIGIAAGIWSLFIIVLGSVDHLSLGVVLACIALIVIYVLQVLLTSYYPPSMRAVLIGSSCAVTAPLLLAWGSNGPWLLVAFAILLTVMAVVASLLERQARWLVILQLRNKQVAERLTRANQTATEALSQAIWLASRDSLTGLLNRGTITQNFGKQPATPTDVQRYVALIDLDHFKVINDRSGHLVGDQVLVRVSQILLAWERLGTGRQVGRWGGEEFIATFECRSRVQAGLHVERLRRLIGQVSVSLDDGHDVEVTASIGLAQVSPLEGLEGALLRADEALYKAKETGRNRCQLAA